nr:sec14 cytosolic factor [Quercus suber]
MDRDVSFQHFKNLCAVQGLLKNDALDANEDDTQSGIWDDGTLIDKRGSPVYLFEVGHLTSDVMAAYNKSCNRGAMRYQGTQTESEAMLRLFCTYENLTRFVLPLCSAVQARSSPELFVADTTCIVDVSGVGVLQFLRLRNHMQAGSTLATAHYPETLGKTFIIGAPPYFSTVWSWINKWFDENTVSKIQIIAAGEEFEILSKSIEPANIPHKYGGGHRFQFGMLPDLDPEIRDKVEWLANEDGETIQAIPNGPSRWVRRGDGKRNALAVGSEEGTARRRPVLAI